MAIAAAMLSSCGNSTPKASLKSDVDSMSYAIGVGQAQGLKEYLVYRMGVDTTYMDEFVKGLNEGASAGDDKKKAAYYAGIQIGQQISTQLVKGINHEVFGDDSTQTVSMKNLMAGFIGSVTGKKGLMTVEQAQQVANMKIRQIKAKSMEKIYGDNKKKGEQFLAAAPGERVVSGSGSPARSSTASARSEMIRSMPATIRSHRSTWPRMTATSSRGAPSSVLVSRAIWLTLIPIRQISLRIRRSSRTMGESCSFRSIACWPSAWRKSSTAARAIDWPRSEETRRISCLVSSSTRMMMILSRRTPSRCIWFAVILLFSPVPVQKFPGLSRPFSLSDPVFRPVALGCFPPAPAGGGRHGLYIQTV